MHITSHISFLKKELFDLQGVYLFGSVATGSETEHSDIDIAVLCSRRIDPKIKIKLTNQLEDTLQKNIDFIELRFVNTILQEEILRTAKRILTVDELACEKYEDYIFCSAMDFREFRKPHALEIIARGNVYG